MCRKTWLRVAQPFLDYAGEKFGQSARSSLVAGKIVVSDVDEILLAKFKNEQAKKTT